MPVDIKGYRVFIASPSGLEEERQAFRDTIMEYNEAEAIPRRVMFEAVGWEYTLPGMGRPQSLINEEVRECDYFILVLWDRWGSPPGESGKGEYTSGTEEEYNVALECFKDDNSPMRQIVVLFKAVGERRLSDPGEELSKVLEFRKELEREKKLMFRTLDEVKDFEMWLRRLLGEWKRDHESGETEKVTKPEPSPDITESKGDEEVVKATEKELSSVDSRTEEMIKDARRLADDGRLTDAEVLFAKAVVGKSDPYAYTAYGHFLKRVGRVGQAEVMFEKALDIYGRLDHQGGIASAYGNLGLVYRRRGELDKAEEMHKKSLEIEKKLGRLEGIAKDYGNLGLVYQRRGELDKAEEMHKKSLEINEKLGRLEGMANQYGNLGLIYRKRGELDKAEEMHKKSLEIEKKLGRLEGIAKDYGNLGPIYMERGELDKAEEMHKKSLEIMKELGNQEGMASNYGGLGLIYRTRGELEKAEEMHKKSLEIEEKLGRLEGMANQYGNLGLIYGTRGELDKAEEMFNKILEIHKQIGSKEGMANDYGNLGIVYKQRGDIEKAKGYWRKAVDLYERIGMPNMVEKTQVLIDGLSEK